MGPHPTEFRHPPFAHSSGRFCFAKPDRCQGREAWRGHWVPIPRSFDICLSPTLSGLFCCAKTGGCQGEEALGGYWIPIPRGFSVRSSPVWGERMSRNMDSEKTGRLPHTIYNGVSAPLKIEWTDCGKELAAGQQKKAAERLPLEGENAAPRPPLFLCRAAPSARAGRAGENIALSRRAGAERCRSHRGRWDGFLLATRGRIWYNYLVMKQGKRALWYADMRVLCDRAP